MSLSGSEIVSAILGEPSVDERIGDLVEILAHHQEQLAEIGTLAARVDEVLHHRTPTLDEARGACNEAGVHAARAELKRSLDRIEAAQAAKRAADEEARLAAEAEADALTDAEWTLDAHFETEGNKTFLVWNGERRAMTADERRAWKAQQAKTLPLVVEAADQRRAAEQRVAESRHALEIAEKYHSVCRADLEAAIAVLATIRLALTDGGAR